MGCSQELHVAAPGDLTPFQGDGGTCFGVRLPSVGRIVRGNGSMKTLHGGTLCESRSVETSGSITALKRGSVNLSVPSQKCSEGGGLSPKKRDIGDILRNEVGLGQWEGDSPRIRGGRNSPGTSARQWEGDSPRMRGGRNSPGTSASTS